MAHTTLRASRRLYLQVLIVLIGLSITIVPNAHARSGGLSTSAKNAVLMDAQSGAIMFQRNADELAAPASMSKLMTVAVIFKALKEGSLKMDDTFKVSEHAWRTGGAPSRTSAMFAGLGKDIPLSELIKGIIIQSGNDACIVVAEGMAGNEDRFAQIMTKQARELGLRKSTFGNPTGLPDPRQRMTAKEIAVLARHLIYTYPEYYKYFAQPKFPYKPPGRKRPYAFFNRNPLLSSELGVDGLKTGYTKEAGYGMVASAEQEGRRLIAVVMGLKTAKQRKNETAKLLEWGFKNFARFKIFDAEEIVGYARVWGGDHLFLPLQGNGDVSVVLPKHPKNPRLRGEVIYRSPLKPPIKKGAEVARLRVVSSSNAVSEVPLYAAAAVEPAGTMRRGLDSLFHLAFGWVADTASDLVSGSDDEVEEPNDAAPKIRGLAGTGNPVTTKNPVSTRKTGQVQNPVTNKNPVSTKSPVTTRN